MITYSVKISISVSPLKLTEGFTFASAQERRRFIEKLPEGIHVLAIHEVNLSTADSALSQIQGVLELVR